ncbi:hypothetical protein Chor_000761 [Crotalus horridus]
MACVTVETVTARLVGMAINVSSNVTSPPGRSRRSVPLQMAKSAATEEHVCVENAYVMMLTQLEIGEIFTEIPANVMNETARQPMIDTQMISVQVMASVTVDDVTVRQDGQGRSVNIQFLVLSQLKRALGNAKEIHIFRVLAKVGYLDFPG